MEANSAPQPASEAAASVASSSQPVDASRDERRIGFLDIMALFLDRRRGMVLVVALVGDEADLAGIAGRRPQAPDVE